MKYLLSILSTTLTLLVFSQCQITLRPGEEGKDAKLFNLDCNSSYAVSNGACDTVNYGDADELLASKWTHWGTPSQSMALMEFDFSSIQSLGCTVSEAKLVLHNTGISTQYNCGQNSTIHPCNDNSFTVERVNSIWSESTVNFVNQPTTVSLVPGQDVVVVPNNDDPYSPYEIDMTDMVNYWLANPAENMGFMMKPGDSPYYKRSIFASSDHADEWRRPALVLTLDCGSTMTCSNVLSGFVFDDANANCNYESNESVKEGWMIKVEPGPFYTTTDANGFYSLNVPEGTYQVSQILPNDYWYSGDCPSGYIYSVDIQNPGDSIGDLNFGVTSSIYCADLSVDIGASFLRKCHTELYYIQYCNNGNLDAEDAYIEIELDPLLTPINSSLPWTQVNGNIYTFSVGDLAANECGNFNMEVQVSCDVEIGETRCVEARIYPQNNCSEPEDEEWDQSSVQVNGECQDSLVCFTISNTGDLGDGDMQGTTEYRIYVDNVMVDFGEVQLQGQETIEICWPANGQTVKLECDQRPGHPGNSHPNEIIEGCGEEGDDITYGVVNSTLQDDQDVFTDIECLEVVASYDPNDKTPSPFGYSEFNFIPKDIQLEYKIRFQNTGNDTAFVIVVRDTIDQNVLDISSVVSGVSSHNYTFDVVGPGVLEWTFDQILLPDSATNEEGSKGFVKFKIDLVEGLEPGERILNQVDIYFDFNEPVETNVASNTIQKPEDYPDVQGIEDYDLGFVKVYPNPSNGIVNIYLDNAQNFEVELLDVSGRIMNNYKCSGSFTTLDLSMYKGLYLLRIKSDNKVGIQKIKLQ